MGKIYPDLAGGYKGSIGGTTYYFWKGDNIARKKGIPGKKSKSEKVVEQRMKFTELSLLALAMCHVSEVGFPQRDRKWTPSNAFFSCNKDVCSVEDGVVVVDYERLKCSKGRLMLPEVTATLDVETGKVMFSQTEMEVDSDCYLDDRVYGVLLEKEQKLCRLVALRDRGESGSTSASIPRTWKVESVEAYAFAVRADGKMASNTLHVNLGSGD
ncbi:DUF6266 family protein [Butyricimonas sp. Marseille-P3923]|uniref:DUF6266 family protein n=1 Tax=Butyricimonas sp. Marseille-P3923 TaxID=1987504 RepID=UPI000C06F893|nr:DUF6266 family protein [Butyricimonas sp. Marseille-P3923]